MRSIQIIHCKIFFGKVRSRTHGWGGLRLHWLAGGLMCEIVSVTAPARRAHHGGGLASLDMDTVDRPRKADNAYYVKSIMVTYQ